MQWPIREGPSFAMMMMKMKMTMLIPPGSTNRSTVLHEI